MTQRIALIDPVGSKAGIDHYSLLVLRGILEAGAEVSYYSNFQYNDTDIRYRQVFHNTGVSKWKAVLSNFTGFFTALRDAKRNKVEWLILHVFRAGVFDLFTFSLARLMGFRILAIVHDIESLDTFTIPFVRTSVTNRLPHVKVVHNAFSKQELGKSIGEKGLDTTYVIPHVNFTDIFSDYHKAGATEQLRLREQVLNGMDERIVPLLKAKQPVLLFFGQIKKAKGLEVLLEAMSQCQTPFSLVVAGKPRNENWEHYADICSVLNIHDRVIPVIRHISEEERDVLFATTNGIVLPYTHIYQSGVLLMAMSFPVAAIASDLPPNADFIQHGKNGLLFRSEDAKDLAKQIDALLGDAAQAEKMRMHALTDVQDVCNYRRVGRLFLESINDSKI